MGWLSSLFHQEKKYEKLVQITIHNRIIGIGDDLVFTQLPNEEYFINHIEFHISRLILINNDTVNHIFSNIKEGKQNIPFDITVTETNKKTVSITAASISDFSKCIVDTYHVTFENVTLTVKVNDVLY
jgi:hypothetical protein